jgi:hypothetical protein
MPASRKQAQHASGVGSVARLAQDFCVYDDDGVRAENEVVWTLTKHGQGFFPCHAFGKRSRCFSRLGHFGDISRLHFKRNTCVAQKLLAAGRGGGEYQHET